MHYVAVENGVKSSRLWQIISLWILTQNFQKFAQSSLNSPKTQIKTNSKHMYLNNKKKSLNSPKTQIKTNSKHIYLNNMKKLNKTCWGCLIGLKKPSCNKKTKLEKEQFEQTPPNRKKKHSKSGQILILQYFLMFTKGIKAKLKWLESESDIFP